MWYLTLLSTHPSGFYASSSSQAFKHTTLAPSLTSLFRPSPYLHHNILDIFDASNMSAYMVPSLRLTLNEIIIAIWFSVLGIELRDVAHFMAYRLNRPPRTEPAIFNHMDRINNGQLQRGCPALCTPGMADWDKAAVHDYLIRLTDDANLLANLLWFDNRHLPLLEEVCPSVSLAFLFANETTIAVRGHSHT